jgi:hypothetical protein
MCLEFGLTGNRRSRFRQFLPGGTGTLRARIRIRANLEALEVLRALQGENRQATDAEKAVLARWGSWGGRSRTAPARAGRDLAIKAT